MRGLRRSGAIGWRPQGRLWFRLTGMRSGRRWWSSSRSGGRLGRSRELCWSDCRYSRVPASDILKADSIINGLTGVNPKHLHPEVYRAVTESVNGYWQREYDSGTETVARRNHNTQAHLLCRGSRGNRESALSSFVCRGVRHLLCTRSRHRPWRDALCGREATNAARIPHSVGGQERSSAV